MKYFN